MRMQDETQTKTATAEAKRVVGAALAIEAPDDDEFVADTIHDALNLASSSSL